MIFLVTVLIGFGVLAVAALVVCLRVDRSRTRSQDGDYEEYGHG